MSMRARSDNARLLTLGHSPDSDDAFMFYGLAEGKVDTGGLRFEHILRDIQTLNDWARDGKLDCTALSVHAYAYVQERYAVLAHGASMGDGYGPMLVARTPVPRGDLRNRTFAVPGRLTSAFLALGLYLGGSFEHTVVPFDQIMGVVSDGRADVGLIIHEGQLTHRNHGLECLVDLGAWWKDQTGLPLPLGVNTIRRDLPAEVRSHASHALRASIVYGLEHRADAIRHAMRFARDMDTGTVDRFVSMYVNDWTVNMNEDGKRSIRLFLERGAGLGLVPPAVDIEFVD